MAVGNVQTVKEVAPTRSAPQQQPLPPTQRILAYALLILVSIAMGLPLYWAVITSLKTPQELFQAPPTWIPRNPTLENFPQAWSAAPFGRYYLNSIFITATSTAIRIVLAIMTAYAFAFLRFPAKNALFFLILGALMIPEEVSIIPNFLTVANLGWVNTFRGIIVPGLGIAFAAFLLRQSFLSLPRDVVDAAHVDGASHLRLLFNVVVPMVQPTLVTALLLILADRWNEFLWPLIVTTTSDMRTLPIGVYFLKASEGVIDWGVVMAGSLFLIVPVLIVFVALQRFIVEGIATGAVKG
jgi:sn-glycerol 3-phosphate transport system permease protein